MIAQAPKLERLGLAEQVAPASRTLRPGLEDTLRQLAIRGDIIKAMHLARAANPIAAAQIARSGRC